MKTAPTAASVLLSAQADAHTQNGDEAIHALVNHLTNAWNRNDAAAWAEPFIDDANFINVRGDLVQGRAAIEKIHAFIFNGPYKDSHCEMKIESLRYPAPGVAVVETLTGITNLKGLPPGLMETEPGILRTRLKFILAENDKAWKIFAAHNTGIVPQLMTIPK